MGKLKNYHLNYLNMKIIFNKKIIISFIILIIIPAIFTLLDTYLSSGKKIENFVFMYNHSNTILFTFLFDTWLKWSSIYLTTIILLYNYVISILLYNISLFTKKYIIIISLIISIFISFFWWLLTML